MRLGWLLVGLWVSGCGPSVGGGTANDDGQGSSGGEATGHGASASGSDGAQMDASASGEEGGSTGAVDPPGADGSTGAGAEEATGDSTGATSRDCVSGTWRRRYESFIFNSTFTPCGEDVRWIVGSNLPGGLFYCEYAWVELTGEVCPEEQDGEPILVVYVDEGAGPCALPEELACSDADLFCYEGSGSMCTNDCDLYEDNCPDGFYCGVSEPDLHDAHCYAEEAPVPLGEPCIPTSGACGPGAACLGDDDFTEPVCRAVCNPDDPNACDGAGPCVECNVSNHVGVCGEPTPTSCVD